MIGDSYSADIQGAHKVDLPGVLVRDTHPAVKHVCGDLSKLDEILAGQ
jgi:FMN phosphatase YigB (HAD superfamily)